MTDLENYENLQEEYRKLFDQYEKIKKDNPQSTALEKTVKAIDEKQKELKVIFSKLY